MKLPGNRIKREKRTISAMLRIWCRSAHGTASGICSQCQDVETYAHERLEKCRFGADKPTCVNCPVHCYRPAMKEIVKEVMRYAGPRMLLRHPYLAVQHIIDEWCEKWDGKPCEGLKPRKTQTKSNT